MLKRHHPAGSFTRSLVTLLVMLVMLVSSSSCSPARYSGPADSIVLGTSLLEVAIPIFVAAERGMFAQNGINVTVKNYESGAASANGLTNGEVDMALLSEYVLVGKAFDGQAIKAIGTLERVDFAFFVARKDRGIACMSDLKGKKVGVLRGTNLEFYLGRSLALHGITADDVTVVASAGRAESLDTFVRGDVDAVVSVEPYVSALRSQLGENAVVWPAQSSQPVFELMVCRNDWVTRNPELTERFLKAIDQAETHMSQHPDEAKATAKQELSLTDEQVAAVWARNQFVLSLDLALVAAMEDEARWMISNDLTDKRQVPDFLDYVYLAGLKAVKPAAVTVIH